MVNNKRVTPPDWIVVLASPRSCSTVVSAMLGCHPQMFAFSEFAILSYPSVAALLADDRKMFKEQRIRHARSAGVTRALIQLKQFPQNDLGVDAARNWLLKRSHWSNDTLLKWFRYAIHPKIAVAKSTTVSQNPAAMTDISRKMRNAVFLHLVRHPIAIIQSQLKFTDRSELFKEDYPAAIAAGLVYQHRSTLEFLASLPVEQCLRVRAEDMLTEPTVLARLVRTLGLSSSEASIAAMMHPEEWVFARQGPTSLDHEGDIGFFTSPSICRKKCNLRLEVPSTWQLPPFLLADITRIAEIDGYRIG